MTKDAPKSLSRLVFNNKQNLFFVKSKCYKKETDKLHMLNAYKIPAKEHQVVHH